jgi:CheY-like chemotaxis protein
MPDYQPLDLNRMRDVIRYESARIKLRSFSTEGETAFTLALALSAAVKKIFFEKSEMTFSSEPKLEKKLVTQFAHRMRVDAMEKFNATTVFSVIEMALTEETLKRQEYVMTLLIYLEKNFLPEFLRMLQYPYIDFDEDAEVMDGCGTLINLIAGQYKKELANLGYKDLMMSPFESFINNATDGVAIPHQATEKYEITFEVGGRKSLVVELVSLTSLPKWTFKDKVEKKKVLVIDDDPVFIKTIDPFLRSRGFEVVIARDGLEGMQQLKQKPHLVILDLQMPNMDGYGFILAMQETTGILPVPIIVLTAKEGLADITSLEGIRDYIVKPFQSDALLRSIERCI